MTGVLKLLLKAMRGDIILLTYHVTPDMTYTKNLAIMRLTESQAYSMGYRRGYRMLDQWRYLPFKTYVKFQNCKSPQFPTQTIDDDDTEYVTLETAGTLFDSYRSKSAEKFVKGMTKASITAGDQKKLLLVIAIGAIAAAAMAFLFLR